MHVVTKGIPGLQANEFIYKEKNLSHFLSSSPAADIDECAEGLSSCGADVECVNLPGGHRCRCPSGFELGFDGDTCVGE